MEDLHTVKLLVIDDFSSFFEIISHYADICSHLVRIECKYAACESEALGIIKEWDPSVVLVDLYLPDLNGFDFVERYRDMLPPIIITCESRSRELEERARLRGASAYLQKSDNPDDMEYVLNKIINVATPLAHYRL